MTQSFQTTNEDILQSVIYAYGTIASRFSSEEFAKYQTLVMNSINHLLARPVTEVNGLTYDNAVASFGKIVLKHLSNTSEANNLITQYLNLFPLKYDLEESEKVTVNLLRLLDQGHPLLTNEAILPVAKEAIKRINAFRTDEGEILESEGVALLVIVTNKYQIN